jgi:hypothetical protein
MASVDASDAFWYYPKMIADEPFFPRALAPAFEACFAKSSVKGLFTRPEREIICVLEILGGEAKVDAIWQMMISFVRWRWGIGKLLGKLVVRDPTPDLMRLENRGVLEKRRPGSFALRETPELKGARNLMRWVDNRTNTVRLSAYALKYPLFVNYK